MATGIDWNRDIPDTAQLIEQIVYDVWNEFKEELFVLLALRNKTYGLQLSHVESSTR